MKKSHLFFASAMVLGFMLSACSEELEAPVANGDGTVTFTAKMPGEVQSRAYSSGNNATQLSYAVYEKGTRTVVFSSDQSDAPKAVYNNDRTFSLTLNLVKGQTYDLIFWADKETSSPYTFVPAAQSITVSYKDVSCNDDSRDAFFSAEKNFTVTGAMKKEIKLYRPFAQLNIGTNDIEAAERANITLGQTKVIVKDVYQTLNLFTGVAADPTDVTYGFADLPDGETFPAGVDPLTGNSPYTYLSMNYLLTGTQIIGEDVNQAQKETKDITIGIIDENGKSVNEFNLSAVPFQRNYRTNIFGALLTSQIDYVIQIVPDYNLPSIDKEYGDPWDGTSKKTPEKNAEGKYEITSAAEFIGFAEMMTSQANFAGETFVLTESINLGGHKFTGIGANNKSFNGTIEGNGHTISNFYTTEPTETQPQYATALIPSFRGVVKDLIVENAKIGTYFKGNTYGNIVGVIAGYSNGTMENVTVRNCEVYGFGKVGGLAGMDETPDNGNRYKNCRVENTKILGTYNSAQLVGLSHNDLDLSSCTVDGNTIECGHYGDTQWKAIGQTVAYDKAKGQRPAIMVDGYFVDLGTYFATGATYYNRYNVLGNEGYRVTWDGKEVEIDGYPVNDLNTPSTDLPAGISAVVEGAEGFYVNGTAEYYVTSANGMKALNEYWTAQRMSNSAIYGRTINIMADIDATGITWKAPFITPGSNTLNGFVINGNSHTIKGMSLNGGLICGMVNGSNEGTQPAVVRDLTFDGCTSTGSYHVGILGAQIYGALTIENVHVSNCSVTGTCNVGGIIGSSTVEGANASITFNSCSVTGSTITATGAEGCDPTGASIFLGRALNTVSNTSAIAFDAACNESGNTVNNAEGLVGGKWYARTTYDNGWKNTEAMN